MLPVTDIRLGRERRKDELLANKFLGKNRRASAPGATNNNRKPGTGPSLASRMGVGKVWRLLAGVYKSTNLTIE